MEPARHIAILAGATLVYLVIDTYPIVKSFRYTLTTGSFWLLAVLFTVLNTVAFGALNITVGGKMQEWVGPQTSSLAMILLSTLGTIGILQSLTLKIADLKFIDLGKLVDGLKGRVLEDIAKNSADQQRMVAMKAADQLFQRYGTNQSVLRNEFASIMAFAGQTTIEVKTELVTLETECQASGLSFSRALSRRIAQIDVQRAMLLARSRTEVGAESSTQSETG
jgi:hypothetical protein